MDSLIEKAAEKIAPDSSFSISTVIPKKWLEREERLWDSRLEGCESIKTYANRHAGRALGKKTGARPDTDGDVRIVFDIEKGEVTAEPNDIFIFGRYKKLVAGISQSRWKCTECNGKGCKKCEGKGKMYESVEEKIGEVMKGETGAGDYSMHASGREDIDVVTTAGRPFVMQMAAAKSRKPDLGKIAKEIAGGKEVAVSDLKIVKRGAVELVASSHFDKEYEAEVEFEKEPGKEQVDAILSLGGKTIEQLTPERVAHRRAILTRRRKILGIKLISRKGKTARFVIETEAGTYIKELITGDNERTRPSFSSILGMKAGCVSLKVVKIEDEFLRETME